MRGHFWLCSAALQMLNIYINIAIMSDEICFDRGQCIQLNSEQWIRWIIKHDEYSMSIEVDKYFVIPRTRGKQYVELWI